MELAGSADTKLLHHVLGGAQVAVVVAVVLPGNEHQQWMRLAHSVELRGAQHVVRHHDEGVPTSAPRQLSPLTLRYARAVAHLVCCSKRFAWFSIASRSGKISPMRV